MPEPTPPAMRWNVRLLAALTRLGAALPLSWLHALARPLAALARWANTREFRVARRNVALCFPDLDAAGQERFVRAALRETARSVLELAWFWGGPPGRALGLIREIRGREHFDAALAAGRGVLLAAPHLGAWELLNYWLSTQGRLAILYRAPQHAEYEPWLNASRERLGAQAVRADAAGVRALFRRLRDGFIVGILPDQRPKGGEGADAPFFGHPVRSMTLLSRLAHKTGAPVVFGFAERLPDARGFRLHFLPSDAAIADADPAIAVAALHRGLEACVAIAPTQYQWTYKRFSFPREGQEDSVYGRLR
jgi:KDO2-lipid IV(A) lauroyltransferase